MHTEHAALILSAYSGRKCSPKKLSIVPDPNRADIYAVRWRGVADFLLTEAATLSAEVDAVEEVEFTQWPPVVSGGSNVEGH